jgi:hypothetical protein
VVQQRIGNYFPHLQQQILPTAIFRRVHREIAALIIAVAVVHPVCAGLIKLCGKIQQC